MFHQKAQARSGDDAEEKQAHAAHDRRRDAVDEFTQFADEGQENGEDCRRADDPDTVDFRNGHDADVFPVGRVRRGAAKARQDVGTAVGEQGMVQAGILDQVAANDVPRHHEVADMFRQDNEGRRGDNRHGIPVPRGGAEMRQGEPGSLDDGCQVDHAQKESEDVAADDADENRNDGQEAAEGDGAEDGHGQGEEGDDDVIQNDVVSRQARHGSGRRSQFQADDGDDGTHGRGRENQVDPAGADHLDEKGEQNEQQAEDDKARLGVRIGVGGENQQDRRNEGEARPQIGRDLSLGQENVEQGAHAVHEEASVRIEVEQERDEYRGAEHGEQMLDPQGDG